MRAPFLKSLPALLAGVLLCFLPGCASMPDGLIAAAAAQAREDARPVINTHLKPVVEGAPTCIERGAGMAFDPPCVDGEGAAWVYVPLVVAYLVIIIGYSFGWCCVRLYELIDEALSAPPEETPVKEETAP